MDPTTGFEWVRGGTIWTFGKLVLALDKDYTCKQIYALYRTLHIVAAPASGSVAGVTHSPF